MKMKVLRNINSVPVYECDFLNDVESELTLEKFDSEPVYFRSVIKPMLAIGHEGELIVWLKNIGLLQHSQRCTNIVNDLPCHGVMTWVPAKILDQYQWKCKNCLKKRNIREKSVFQDVKCKFKDIIRLLAGWSKGIDVEVLSKLLCIKKQTANSVFNVASVVADKYIKSHLSRWNLGGPGIVVLIDVYPVGFKDFDCQDIHAQNATQILCIAEVKEMPTRFWLQVLDRYNVNVTEQIDEVNKAALQVVREIVLPGSILVTNYENAICSYESLLSLSHLYPGIVTKDGLKRHDHFNQLLGNLETIWAPVLKICNEVQYLSNTQIQHFIVNFLWRQKFDLESFENLLNQMCYNFI